MQFPNATGRRVKFQGPRSLRGSASGPAVSIDFVAGTYSASGVKYGSLAAMAGYSYVRSGTLIVSDTDSGMDAFTANSPPINGYGYHAYGALTNSYLHSREFDDAIWIHPTLTSVPNALLAPDGTTTVDKWQDTDTGGTSLVHYVGQTGATYATGDTVQMIVNCADYPYMRLDTGNVDASRIVWDMTNGTIAATNGVSNNYWTNPFIQPLGNGFYKIGATVGTSNVTSARWKAGTVILAGQYASDGTKGFYTWEGAQFKGANLPLGGPVIQTTTAAASIGDPTFQVNCPNGTYTATYTFSDGSTQDIPTVVSGGKFALPTYPTLNRPLVTRVVLK